MLRSAIRLKQKLRIQFPFLVFNLGVDVRKELMVKVNSFSCSSVPELFTLFFRRMETNSFHSARNLWQSSRTKLVNFLRQLTNLLICNFSIFKFFGSFEFSMASMCILLVKNCIGNSYRFITFSKIVQFFTCSSFTFSCENVHAQPRQWKFYFI